MNGGDSFEKGAFALGPNGTNSDRAETGGGMQDGTARNEAEGKMSGTKTGGAAMEPGGAAFGPGAGNGAAARGGAPSAPEGRPGDGPAAFSRAKTPARAGVDSAPLSPKRADPSLPLRARNLMWTVGGDHALNAGVDPAAFADSEARTLYEAVKLGGANRLFGLDAVLLFCLQKQYMGADPALLSRSTSLVLDAAASQPLETARAGVREMRERAYNDALDEDFARLTRDAIGQLEYSYMLGILGRDGVCPNALTGGLALLRDLEADSTPAGCGLDGPAGAEQNGKASPHFSAPGPVKGGKAALSPDDGSSAGVHNSHSPKTARADAVIAALHTLYDRYADPEFGKRGYTLEETRAVTLQELVDAGFLDAGEALDYAESAAQNAGAGGDSYHTQRGDLQEIDPQQAARMDKYMRQVFGESLLTDNERAALEAALCTGLHGDRRLYLTEGLLRGPAQNTIHYKVAQQHRYHNQRDYHRAHRVVKQNIYQLTGLLRRALLRRTEAEFEAADAGALAANRLWRVGRASTGKLFDRRINGLTADFVVDVLVDGSGSQGRRQGAVASQTYILSRALAANGIPHRVLSYCAVFDTTVLQRLRDYDEPPAACERIFEYMARAVNRDGLAIRAAVHTLRARNEENKILIVLSDGRPNDVGIKDGKRSTAYVSERAVEDTAFEVRRARSLGISVFGVFAGLDEDLDAERRIFGRDFAYIRSIETFSSVVGRYLQRCIDAE